MSKQDSQPLDLSVAEELEGESGGEMLLELMLAEREALAREQEATRDPAPPELPARIDGVLIGRLAKLDENGDPVVTFEGSPVEGLPARAMTAIETRDVGSEVALMFEGGNPLRPVVMGRMHVSDKIRHEAHADGERVEISAEKELILRCGKASITLTRAGKIILRGAYLVSRSSGVNRIQGGSVQIN